MATEIRGVTWDFGDEAPMWPSVALRYLYNAKVMRNSVAVYPFRDAKMLAVAGAVMGGESAWYPKAWHANVVKDADGQIVYDAQGRITVKSIDLGWIQRNADLADTAYQPEEIAPLVVSLFESEQYGYLDRPGLAANEAARLYVERGWQPWYAYSNKGYLRHLPKSILGAANFLAIEFGLGQSYYMIRPRT